MPPSLASVFPSWSNFKAGGRRGTLLALTLGSSCLAMGQEAVPVSPWGIAGSASSARDAADWFPKVVAAGAKTVRLFPEWRGVEPAPEQWKWESTDALVRTAQTHGVQLNGILMGAAPGTKDRIHAFPMEHLDGWARFVSTAVGRYAKDIRYWEVWNEGNAGFNDGKHTTTDYAKLAAATYVAAKKANPAAQVGLTVASFDPAYFREAMRAMSRAGAGGQFDFLCIHPYEIADGLGDRGGEIPFLWMAHQLRAVLKAEAPAREKAELWITEVGRRLQDRPREHGSEEAIAVALPKIFAMALAQGFRCTQWFEGQDPQGEESGFGLLRRDGTPRASYRALQTLTRRLGAAPKYDGWLAPGEGGRGYGFVFTGSAGSVLVAWMPGREEDRTVKFTAETTTVDVLTGQEAKLAASVPLSLTDRPVLVENLPAGLVEQARKNAPGKFPWGGDFTGAKSVAMELGRPSGERGVFHVGGQAFPSHTFADGSTGVKVRTGQSARFFAHPTFADLATSEYYVRITVRRLEPGNAGMNCHYEVADSQGRMPYKNCGQWFSVAKDDGWQTYTWQLKGACLAKMWGYDFSITPEQSVPFVLGKVELSTVPFAPAK